MPFSWKVVLLSIVSLVVVAAVVDLPRPAYAATTASFPYHATADGPYTVQGNKIIGADGTQYLFHGVGRDGLEYHCPGDQFFSQQYLAYMGSGTNTASGTYWDSNTVRLPLSEGFWLYGDVAQPGSPPPSTPCSSSSYQSLVKQVVDSLTSLHLNVILDLQWSDAISTSGNIQSWDGGGPWAMPDSDSVKFWQQVAPMFSGYSNVLFELFNEPHPPGYQSPGAWSCWAYGCTVTNDYSYSSDCGCMRTLPQPYQGVSMEALINAVRSTVATNLILVGGIDWSYDLSQIANPAYNVPGSNLVYDTHPYPYGEKLPNMWDASFGNISATHAVFSAENGEYDCRSSFMSQLFPYLDAHQISWTAWAWAVGNIPCAYPQLISNYQGTPESANAAAVYTYQYLHSYASGAAMHASHT